MKQNRFQVFVLGVVFVVNSMGATTWARGSELLSLLEMPATRLILTETPEGAAIAERLLGRQITSEADLVLLFQSAARSQNAELARVLESRLVQVQRDLRFYALATEGEGDLRGLISELAKNRLKIAPGSAGFAESEGVAELEKLKAQAQEALKQAQSATAGEGAQVPTPAKSLVAMELSGIRLGAETSLASSQASYSRIRNAVIEGTDLSGDVFDFSDFRGSNIRWANFKGASLKGADLSGVKLLENNFMGADLTGANLSRSQLRGCDFSGADLRGANLSDATVGGSFFRQGSVEANFEGALFDAQTKLPFDREQAKKLGMIFLVD